MFHRQIYTGGWDWLSCVLCKAYSLSHWLYLHRRFYLEIEVSHCFQDGEESEEPYWSHFKSRFSFRVVSWFEDSKYEQKG